MANINGVPSTLLSHGIRPHFGPFVSEFHRLHIKPAEKIFISNNLKFLWILTYRLPARAVLFLLRTNVEASTSRGCFWVRRGRISQARRRNSPTKNGKAGDNAHNFIFTAEASVGDASGRRWRRRICVLPSLKV